MLVVWEVSTMPGDRDSPLRALVTRTNAHDAGITTLIVAKDADSSTWYVITKSIHSLSLVG